jgi:ABC-type glutathione transport system ATPase component
VTEPLLDVRDLRVEYGSHCPVDGVNLHLRPGETVGLVGESGSGKSTIGNAILGLVRPSGGRILFRGEDITHATRRRRRTLSRHLQVVFQDPYGSLNPVRAVGGVLAEPLRLAGRLGRAEAARRVAETLRLVGMPADAADRYPAAFSGGQRQRIAIARALSLEPQLIICDEPTSALDLSVQAQILNLLLDLQQRLGLSYLFISHDIDVVRHMSHRIAVLHDGRIVEEGPASEVAADPTDPYTKELLAAVPVPDPHEQAARRASRASAQNRARSMPLSAASTSDAGGAKRAP